MIGVPLVFALLGALSWWLSTDCPKKDGGRGAFRAMAVAWFVVAIYVVIHYIKIGLL